MSKETEQENKYREEFNLGLHPSSTFDIYLAGRKAGQEEIESITSAHCKSVAYASELYDELFKVNQENEKLIAENERWIKRTKFFREKASERLAISIALKQEITRLKDLLKSAKTFIENGHDQECYDLWDSGEICRHDEWLSRVKKEIGG